MSMDEIEVPPFFLCPISLEMMKDPVTVSTGITYDRESIERWVFSGRNNTCPVTKQALGGGADAAIEFTPNITLRRLMQAWCTLNASSGIERLATPKPPVTRTQILKLLNEAANSPQMKLQKLRSIAAHSETNKRSIEAAGAAQFLASIIISSTNDKIQSPRQVSSSSSTTGGDISDEALSVLYNLKLSEGGLRTLFGRKDEFVESLIRVMRHGSYESRAYAVMLLKSMFEVGDPSQLTSLRSELFVELVKVLQDKISDKASKATLRILIQVCPWGRNRIKAAEAGAVALLIDLILDNPEKRVCEMMFTVLDQLCQCAEGRAELVKHGAGLAVVSKKILRVSHVVSERAVKILHSISRLCANTSVLQEMLSLGVVAKLCLVLQVDCGVKIKAIARDILKLHARVWKHSPCIPTNFYPC